MSDSTSATIKSLQARANVRQSWANTDDWSARTQPARDAFREKFERQVDPDGVLDPAERSKRAEQARKAFYSRLAAKSVAARRKAGQG